VSNYHLEPADKPQALTGQAIKALRHEQVQGLSRRQLLRTSIGAAFGLWLLEITAGTISFIWPNLSGGFGGKVQLGTFTDIKAQNTTLPIADGFPAYVPNARAFIVLIDPSRQQFVPGIDTTGAGNSLNVRALYQRCPHLGCKPNPCLKNFWMECPCHGSRYDRLGQKVAGAQYGPAPRSMDRFSTTVDADGTLVVNTGKITLGPLPIALGQPGVIPPRSATGCIQT
jgi:cytochrome b6-f complex iron-sulfur subunit